MYQHATVEGVDFVTSVDVLKKEWFERFDSVVAQNGNGPSSNLQCLEHCQALCCPRVGMRDMEREKIASPIVVLLPFEMEYLIEKVPTTADVFRQWPIEYTPDLIVNIGLLDLGKPCPFLNENRMCGIHQHNPIDCRTFPALPFQGLFGELEWTFAENCPSLHRLNLAFVDNIRELWGNLFPHIPNSWWDLYAFADHWTGWPPHGVADDAT